MGRKKQVIVPLEFEQRDGKLYLNAIEVVRHLSPSQENDRCIQGWYLHKELVQGKQRTATGWIHDVLPKKQVLNGDALWMLFRQKELIPEEWKMGDNYFWGTERPTYKFPHPSRTVDYLFWKTFNGEPRWEISSKLTINGWDSKDFAICLAEDLPQ